MTVRSSILILALLLVISAAPAALADGECESRESNYARAVQLHEMGDYSRALRHYECALREDPQDEIIPILIENVYDDIARSATAWSGGDEAAPDQVCDPAPDHARIGADAYEDGDFVLADIHLQCALIHDPDNLQALTMLGHIYMNRGDTRSAKYYFDRAYDLRASYIAIPTRQPSEAHAADEAPAGFVMPDWLGPYETAPRARYRRQAIDVAAALRQVPARNTRTAAAPRDESGAWALVRGGQIFLIRLRIGRRPGLATEPPDAELAHRQSRCELGRLYLAQGDYSAAFGQLYPLLANGLYDQCPD